MASNQLRATKVKAVKKAALKSMKTKATTVLQNTDSKLTGASSTSAPFKDAKAVKVEKKTDAKASAL